MTRTGVFFCLFIFTWLYACKQGPDPNHEAALFTYNESKGIASLDPAHARNQTIIWPVTQLFNGLVELDQDLRVHPSVAKEWTISEDGLTYTFLLRDDVFFHQCEYFGSRERRVIASDFVFSFERIRDPSVASPGRWIFDHVLEIGGFVARGDSVVEISLKQPFPPFLSILTMPYCAVVPREVVMDPQHDFSRHPVGTGPFMFKFWSQDEKLIFLKNPDYFEFDSVGTRLPYLDAVNVTFIKDKQSEFLEFLKGNVDFLSGVHPAYRDELLTRSGELNPEYLDRIKLLTRPYLNTEYLGILMDAGSNPQLADVRIRKAINLGFNRRRMMKYLRNNLGYPAGGGMIPPGLPGHLEDGAGYTYNPDRARELLAAAGYPGGEGLEPITLTTTSDYLDLCEFIQFELGKIGIQIEIEVSTGASFRNMVANANLPFFRGSWIADYADAENYMALFYSGNHSPEGPNYTHFTSDAFDLLYRESVQTVDQEVRTRLYSQMDSIVISEAPIVPLYYDMVIRFVRRDISGFEPDPMNNMKLKYLRR